MYVAGFSHDEVGIWEPRDRRRVVIYSILYVAEQKRKDGDAYWAKHYMYYMLHALHGSLSMMTSSDIELYLYEALW